MKADRLKKYFWDTDFEKLDIKQHKRYILERILEMGDQQAVDWMFENFSKEDIIDLLKKSRRISRKSLVYWNLVLNK